MDLITMLKNLINPQVMADMVSAKLEKKIKIIPYAKVDTTLQGRAGDTVTIPKFEYIGDAVDVEEGEEIPTRQLQVSSESYKIKKAGIGGILTDEAMLSGYGNPVGELNNQMANSIASKCDTDAMDELYRSKTHFTATDIMGYSAIVNAIDVFNEEVNTEKVGFVHPKQVTQLRLDPDFIAKDKYGNEVMVNGEIGMVSNVRIVPSKKVRLIEYVKDNTSGTITIVSNETTETDTSKHLETIQPKTLEVLAVGDKVKAATAKFYANPIVKLEQDDETEDEAPALTYFIKRDVNVESERKSKRRLTEITGDEMYVVALTNETKVVILKALEKVASV